MTRALALAAAVFALPSCEDREVIRRPSPSLARMLDQRRADTWEASGVFADGKVMRAPPPDTVARDDDRDEPAPPVTKALLADGRTKFDVVCATCHGVRGDGDSVVATKMERRRPPSLHEPRLVALSHEELMAVITDGYGLMPSFAGTLSRRERWAVVAYVDALRLSQSARVAALPDDLKLALAKEEAP